MKNIFKIISLQIFLLLCPTTVSYAYDCESDCTAAATHHELIPCPTMSEPFRKCWNDIFDPAEKLVCETQKEASCKFFNEISSYAQDKVKSLLEGNFNRFAWTKASEEDKEAEYDIQCRAAGVAACAAIGSQIGGPAGAGLSGAIGIFLSSRLCEQSKAW